MVCVVESCDKCPVRSMKGTKRARYNECRHIVNGAGNQVDPKMMIVIDSPFGDDDYFGELGVRGGSYQIVKLLEELDIPLTEVYITLAVRCAAPWNPLRKELEACKGHLAQDIEELKPKVIVPMGNNALWSVTGLEKISDQRGSMFQTEWGIPAVPTFSPGSLYHSSSNKPSMINDLGRAWRIAHGEAIELGKYTVARTVEDVVKIRNILLDSDGFAFDFETTSLNPRVPDSKCSCCHSIKILCASFTHKEGTGFTVPLYKQFTEEYWSSVGEREQVEELLREILTADMYMEASNGKFDIEWAWAYLGINIPYDGDAEYSFAMVHEERPHKLDFQRTLYTNMPRYESFKDDPEIKSLIKEHGYAGIPEEMLYQYAAADTDVTFRATSKNLERMARESRGKGGALSKKYQLSKGHKYW